MVLTEHKNFYSEIFKIDGFLKSPFLMFGFQELSEGFDARLKDAKSFKGLLYLMGVKDITVLDYEDKRADVHFDMNYPFNQDINKFIGAFKVVCDIGCLEHVFNSAQAMKNCMDAVEVGGLYFLHTHVAGYCKHGFHTFNCDMLKWVVENNGFGIEYCKYSYKNGIGTSPPQRGPNEGNVIIWLVARRVEVKDKFHLPIQDRQTIHESYRTQTSPWKDERPKDLRNEPSGRHILNPIKDGGKENVYSHTIIDEKDADNNVSIITGGYVGEGHDPIDLSIQNFGL